MLIRKLRDFESMTVNQIFHERTANSGLGSDYSNMEECPNRDATRRLTELGYDAIDGLSRLSLGGKPRLYGIRNQNEFSILWWDPEHQIWPAPKKHT
ncbi:hypothetical protein [Streptomyces longwoodensis]|uniref:hypothetical protein n=1 Tax=Streptomyces longwoodensis TaxID=68231 RepID=UPI0033FAB2AB